MRKDTKILLQRKVRVIYNAISLYGVQGKKRIVRKIDPYLSIGYVDFQIDHVTVGTKSSDETEEVDLTVFEGYPDKENLSPDKICASGLLEVGNDGLYIDMGSYDHDIIPWPSGITSVLVIVDMAEVEKHDVHSVTFFLKNMGRVKKGSGLRKILGI